MKKLFFLLLIFIGYSSFGQSVLPTKEGMVFYEVSDSANKSKEQLYTNAKLWIVNLFRDAKEVIQLDDKETGEILGKGLFRFYYNYWTNTEAVCHFTIKLSLRENKYRIQIYDLTIEQIVTGVKYTMETANANSKKQFYPKVIKIVDEHVTGLLTEGKNKIALGEKDSF